MEHSWDIRGKFMEYQRGMEYMWNINVISIWDDASYMVYNDNIIDKSGDEWFMLLIFYKYG
jgi:hypothetical protein